MVNGLNFNRLLIVVFLPFVSLWISSSGSAQTSGQAKDEFSLFEEEIKDAAPAAKSAAPAAATGESKPAAASEAPASEPVPAETSEQKIERLKVEIRKGPQNVGLVVDLAEELFNRKEFDKVTALLWKHVDKIDRRGLLLLARAHEQRKEPAEMIRALNIQVGKNDKDFEAHSLLGNAHILHRKLPDAMESYKKAIELNSKYEPAYEGLIRMYEQRNPPNWYELRMIYQDMIGTIGKRPQYLRKLCEINTRDDVFESAINVCKEAIQMDSQVADAFVYLGISYKAAGKTKEGAETLKKAAIGFPKSELAQYHHGKYLEEQKNYVDAMKAFKVGTEADDKSARSWLGLATTSFEIRKYEIALLSYRNACKYDKQTAVAFRRATTVLRNQKNSEWLGRFESASESCTY